MNKAKLSRLEKKLSGLYGKVSKDFAKQKYGVELEKMTDDQLESLLDNHLEQMIIEDIRERPEWYEDLLSK